MGEDGSAPGAYVAGEAAAAQGEKGEKGRLSDEVAVAGVGSGGPCRYGGAVPCGCDSSGASAVVRSGGCTARRRRGDRGDGWSGAMAAVSQRARGAGEGSGQLGGGVTPHTTRCGPTMATLRPALGRWAEGGGWPSAFGRAWPVLSQSPPEGFHGTCRLLWRHAVGSTAVLYIAHTYIPTVLLGM